MCIVVVVGCDTASRYLVDAVYGKRMDRGLAGIRRNIGGCRHSPNGVCCYQDIVAMIKANANAITPGAVMMLLLLSTQT